jgi:hypothetical protein
MKRITPLAVPFRLRTGPTNAGIVLPDFYHLFDAINGK